MNTTDKLRQIANQAIRENQIAEQKRFQIRFDDEFNRGVSNLSIIEERARHGHDHYDIYEFEAEHHWWFARPKNMDSVQWKVLNALVEHAKNLEYTASVHHNKYGTYSTWTCRISW